MNNTRGQLTVIGLLLIVLTLIVFAKLYPIIQDAIDEVVPTLDSGSATLLRLVPFAFVIVIIGSVFLYGQAQTA